MNCMHMGKEGNFKLCRATRASPAPNYYCLLLLHLGTNDTARGILDNSSSDYRALGTVLKGMGAHVLFSILVVRGKGVRRRAITGQVNN